MKRVLVPLAEGFEELEAVTVIDLLRRAGIEVVTASLGATKVTGSHGIALQADATLDAVLERAFDMVALPGGQPGATHLENDPRIATLLKRHAAEGRHTAAVCAGPKVLAAAGVLDGRRATAFPGALPQSTGDAVVVDGAVITGRGPGTAMDFALALVEALEGRAKRDEVEAKLAR